MLSSYVLTSCYSGRVSTVEQISLKLAPMVVHNLTMTGNIHWWLKQIEPPLNCPSAFGGVIEITSPVGEVISTFTKATWDVVNTMLLSLFRHYEVDDVPGIAQVLRELRFEGNIRTRCKCSMCALKKPERVAVAPPKLPRDNRRSARQ